MLESPRKWAIVVVAVGLLSSFAPAQAPASKMTGQVDRLLREKVAADHLAGLTTPGQAPDCEKQPTTQVRKNGVLYLRPLGTCRFPIGSEGERFRLTGRPDHGNVTYYHETGELYYSPDPGYTGTDRFKYVVSNAAGSSAERTWRLQVSAAANTAPRCLIAEGELSDGPEGLTGHLRVRDGGSRRAYVWCYDLEEDLLATKVTSGPASGTLTPAAPDPGLLPSVTYSPAAGAASGTKVQASFVVVDSGGLASQEFVVGFETIGAGENTPPMCAGSPSTDPADWQEFVVGRTATVMDAACVDAEDDPVTYTPIEGPEGAVLAVDPDPELEPYFLTATPTASSGHSTFTYKGVDSEGGESDVQTVGLRFLPERSAPLCTSPTVNAVAGVSKAFAVNCTDADGDPLVYRLLPDGGTRPLARHGDVEVGEFADGRLPLTYTSDRGFWGTDSFLLASFDPFHEGPLAKVTLKVAPPKVAPRRPARTRTTGARARR